MKLIKKYDYVPLERQTAIGGFRHYVCPTSGTKLPSVTTILSHTADKSGLLEWRKRVGEKEAQRITNEATALGTLMHTHLECVIEGRDRPTGNNLVRMQAEAMADQIIEYGFKDVDEVWGSEISLYNPGLYAGTCDMVGVYKGKPAIMDFKSATRMKKKEYIEDYMCQMAAYRLAHDELHGTEINTGVIFMVDRDFNYQDFVIEGEEFQFYTNRFLDRLEQFLS